MKYLVWLMSGVNIYVGMRCFLNAIHVLHTSKYSQITTVIFAILFLSLGAAGFYFTIAKGDAKLGLLVSVGPWMLSIVVMFLVLITGKQQRVLFKSTRAGGRKLWRSARPASSCLNSPWARSIYIFLMKPADWLLLLCGRKTCASHF